MTVKEHVFQRRDAGDVFWDWWAANHIDLVAAHNDNLYIFPHNNPVKLNIETWERPLSHAALWLNKSYLLPLFTYLWGKWSWFIHQPVNFLIPEEILSLLCYCAREILFYIYSCNFNVRIKLLSLILSSRFSWSWMGSP